MLNRSASLTMSTSVLKDLPVKLDIKRHSPSILYIHTFSGGVAQVVPSYGQGSGRVWLSNVNCTGDESKLTDCKFTGWGATDCSHDDDVAVKCFSDNKNTGKFLIRCSCRKYFLNPFILEEIPLFINWTNPFPF